MEEMMIGAKTDTEREGTGHGKEKRMGDANIICQMKKEKNKIKNSTKTKTIKPLL